LEELVGALEERGRFVEDSLRERLETGRRIYEQQTEMYRERKHRVDGRIVSCHRDYVRPIKRGKGGRKDTEFGPKGALSPVDGFLFLDKFSHDNYSEATREVVDGQLAAYQQRFGELPSSFTGDRLYGTRENHRLMKERGVRASFKPLGRPKDDGESSKRGFKKKQRERNRIEGVPSATERTTAGWTVSNTMVWRVRRCGFAPPSWP
jgi:IS5 family transposase